VLNVLSPAGGAILGGSRKFRRWGLVRGIRSLGGVPLKFTPGPQFLPCSLLLVHHEVRPSSATHSYHHDVMPMNEVKQPWTHSLKL
jgi:hypothetical protein